MFAALSASSAAFDESFWVWQRVIPLSERERTELKAQVVEALYWHIGEIDFGEGGWRWRSRPIVPPALGFEGKVIPVIRLATGSSSAFSESAKAQLTGLIDSFLTTEIPHPANLQIDFDCPDSLLPSYADWLKAIRGRAGHFSATALGGWIRVPGFSALEASVDELAPMFYDLETDPSPIDEKHPPLPLADPHAIEGRISAWRACKIPWRAGLPNFARVTVFSPEGRSRGHIRNFSWSELCFDPALETETPSNLGVTLFRVVKPASLADTPLSVGETIAARWADPAAVRGAIAAAKAAGAGGVIFFRLPDGTDAGGWSLPAVGALTKGEDPRPMLELRQTPQGGLTLRNASRADLPARLSGPNGSRDRGYALEVDAPAPLFREALEGDFWRVVGHVQPDGRRASAPIPFATRLTFWFSDLRAGESLATGLIQLAPGAAVEQVRWRVVPEDGAAEWRKIERSKNP